MRRTRLLLLGALALGLGAGLAAPGERLREAVLSPFAVERLAAQGLARLSPAELAAAAGVEAGTPFRSVDPAGVAARLRAEPWIREARALRLPPGILLLEVEERRPRAVAEIAGEPAAVFVDDAGLAFAPAEPGHEALPRLHVRPAPGEDAGGLLDAGLAAARLLEAHGLPAPAEVWLDGRGQEGLVLRLPGEAARVVLGAGAWADKLERWKRLRGAGLPETARAGTIDLRFADRVVLRGDASPEGDAAAAARGGALASGGRGSG